MNLIKYNNAKTLLFLSGMFAGGWIWKESHRDIPNTQHLLLDDPLCAIGGRVKTISDHICDEIKSLDRKITLVGNSLGSFICLDIARRQPEFIEKVIISGSAGFGPIDLGIKLSSKKPHSVAKAVVDLVCYDKTKISEEAREKTADSFRDNFRNILGLIRESNKANADKLLSEVQCPVHAIWGENDEITPLADALAVFAAHGVPVNLIEECGHSPMFEKPREFAEHVAACLKA